MSEIFVRVYVCMGKRISSLVTFIAASVFKFPFKEHNVITAWEMLQEVGQPRSACGV